MAENSMKNLDKEVFLRGNGDFENRLNGPFFRDSEIAEAERYIKRKQ
jgi:hypothetical protein